MKHLNRLALLALVALVLCGAQSAFADTFTFVGSYHVGAGPVWFTNPPVFSGQEAAALIFGGSASDYAISTDPSFINHMAFVDGWGVHTFGGTLVSESFSVGCDGGYSPDGFGFPHCGYSTYSAYVDDAYGACCGGGAYGDPINYVWRIEAGGTVPEPGSMVLLGTGLIGAAGTLRRRFLNR